MNGEDCASAERIRHALSAGRNRLLGVSGGQALLSAPRLTDSRPSAGGRCSVPPDEFRAELQRVPFMDRDAWCDVVLQLGSIPDDGPALPSGCVPYLPCPANTVLRMVDLAQVGPDDVFVDLGSGAGRTLALTHLLTGASALGIEIQPELVRLSRAVSLGLNTSRVSIVEGDAAEQVRTLASGSVFFLYCPFSGPRLERTLASLETIARTRPIRVCCVDLPLLPQPWLSLMAAPEDGLAIYRST